jgi:hypothetical protein
MTIDTIQNFKPFFNAFTGQLIDTIGHDARRIVKENTLGQVSVIHVSYGKYHLKSNGLFKSDLTHFHIANQADGYTESTILDENTIEVNILTQKDGDPINNRLYASFMIWVYHSEPARDSFVKTFGNWFWVY